MPKSNRPTLLSIRALLLAACVPTVVTAEDNPVLEDWRPFEALPASEQVGIAPYCPGGFVDPLKLDPTVDPNQPNEQSPITFLFDYSREISKDGAALVGNVSARQNTFRAQADEFIYERPSNSGELLGHVRLRTIGILVTGDEADLNFDNQTSTVDNAHFALHEQDMHGSARTLYRSGGNYLEGRSAAFTRCMPQDPQWLIRAASFEVDRDTGIAKAWHARFEIKSIPVFYFPYVSFPIDDRRRSGFLTATYGLGQGPSFSELAVPYYFNLAPNFDDTLTLHYFSDLGWLARNEFRFLTEQHNGISDIDWQLRNDAELQDETANADKVQRWAVRHRQNGQLTESTSYNLDTRWVSDIQYDQNFNNGGDPVEDQKLNLGLVQQVPTGTVRVNTKATTPVQDSESKFHTASVNASTRIGQLSPSILGEWQEPKDDTVTAAQHGLKRLPEASLRYQPLGLPGSLTFNNTLTYSRFTRELDDARLDTLTGNQVTYATTTHRYYANAGLAYPFDVEWGYLRPEIEGFYWAYDRINELDPDFSFEDPDFQKSPEANAWRFTTDSRMILERPYATADGLVVHSLEPRLHYTYTPYVDQDHLPDLNTSAVSNDFKLFTKSRFSGLDRVGDMNRVSAALDTRLRDRESGSEIVFLGFSKGLKLSQERVTEGDADEIDPDFVPEYSPNYFDARWTPERHLQINASAQWEHRTWDLDGYSLDVTLLPPNRSFLRVGITGEDLTESEGTQSMAVSTYWPLRENLALIGYANWERPLEDGVETDDFRYTDLVYGLDYDSCCWNVRLVGFNSIPDEEDEETTESGLFASREDSGIKFEFTLKGLGGSTGTVESLLDEKVPGYRGRLFTYR